MSDRVPLPPPRSEALGTLIAGVVFMAAFHFLVGRMPRVINVLELVGVLFVVLGIGGLVDPRYYYGAMDYTRGLFPKPVRIVSGALVAAGFGLGFFLLAVVYRVLP